MTYEGMIAKAGRTALMVFIGIAFASAAQFTALDNALAQEKKVLHRGNGAEPDSLDPHKATGTWESSIIGDMIVGLLTEDPEGKPIPGAATSWTISEDGKTYTFKIREGHVWSDGMPVTAHDFVFAFRRILNPATASQYASLLYVVKNAQLVNKSALAEEDLGIRAIDDATLEIELEAPAPFFIAMLRHQTTYPVPKHMIEKLGSDWSRAENWVSNGPYTLAEWRPNDHIRIVKNDKFYDAENVEIEEVYFYPTVDQTAALKQFRAGELDVNNGIPSQQISWIREHLNDELRLFAFMSTTYITFNYLQPPFDNPDIHRALSLAIERDILTDKVLRVGQIPAYSFVPPGMNNYQAGAVLDFKDWPMEKRLEEGRRLLAQAGYDKSNPLRFTYRHYQSTDGRRSAVAVRAMWQRIGVQADLMATETKVHYNDLREQNFEVADAGWVADYNDPQNFLYLLQTSAEDMNYGKFSDPEFDALMDEANATLDLQVRAELMRDAEQIIMDQQPSIPTFFGVNQNLVHTNISGWVDNVANIHRTRYLKINKPS